MEIRPFLKIIIMAAVLAGIIFLAVSFRRPPDTKTKPAEETMAVKIFLSDSRYAGEPHFDCQKTIAVERTVPKTKAVARAAIEALLRGETEEEKEKGYVNNIPAGARLNKIIIENGIAKPDFDEQMEFQMGGSCRVAAIRAQITDTLKQFRAVDNVVISIDGRTEDILQP